MDNKNELSNQASAFFSWLDFIGLVLLILSGTVLKKYDWLLITASLCVLSSFVYRTVSDWHKGRRKLVRTRLILFSAVLIFAIVVGILVVNK